MNNENELYFYEVIYNTLSNERVYIHKPSSFVEYKDLTYKLIYCKGCISLLITSELDVFSFGIQFVRYTDIFTEYIKWKLSN